MADASLRASGIYAIRNIVNGKLYIGSATHFGNRFKAHLSALRRGCHHSEKLQRAWIKYGAAAFEFSILEYVSVKTDLIGFEQSWIDACDVCRVGYNVCPTAGSSLGLKASAETKRRMSASRQNVSAETRAKMSAARKGRPMPAHVKAILSAANKGRPKSPETRAKIAAFRKTFIGWTHSEATKLKIGRSGTENHMFGKRASPATREKVSAGLAGNTNALGFKHTEETRRKVSAAGMGRVQPEEARRKISAANIGRVFSAETRAKMSAAAKARSCHR